MVNSHDRSQYVGPVAGAPPVPPPGGYRAAQRLVTHAPTVPQEPRRRAGALGWTALGVSVLLALVLLVMWAAGATDAIYGVAVLAMQLAVVVTVIAALVSPRNRGVAAAALAVVLLVNVGTVGAASALMRPAGTASDPETDRWAAYPGIKGQTVDEILARTSLEEAQSTAEEVMAEIRERLTARYGFAWVQGRSESTRAERNGYGGESMLVQFSSDVWSTTEPVTDHQLKLDAMATIDAVLVDYGFFTLTSLNDPSSGFDPSFLERFYGSTDPRTQVEWEWYSDDWPGPMRFYANVTDLTHDDDGDFRSAREGQVAGTDEPVEGLRISFYVPEVLSEDDVEEFQRRMADYP